MASASRKQIADSLRASATMRDDVGGGDLGVADSFVVDDDYEDDFSDRVDSMLASAPPPRNPAGRPQTAGGRRPASAMRRKPSSVPKSRPGSAPLARGHGSHTKPTTSNGKEAKSKKARPASAKLTARGRLLNTYFANLSLDTDRLISSERRPKSRSSNSSTSSMRRQKSDAPQKVPSHFEPERMYEDLIAAKRRTNEVEVENTRIKTRALRAEEELARKEKQLEELVSTRSLPGNHFEKLLTDISRTHQLRDKVRSLERGVEERDKELQGLKDNIRFSKVRELETENQAYQLELNRLKRVLQQVQAQYKSVQLDAIRAEENLSKNRSEMSQQHHAIAAEERRKASKEIHVLQEKLQKASLTNKDLREQLADSSTRLSSALKENAALDAKVTQFRLSSAAPSEQSSKPSRPPVVVNSPAPVNTKQLQQQIDSLSEEREEAQRKMSSYRKRISTLEKERDAAKRKVEERNGIIKSLEDRCAAMEQQCAKYAAQAQEAEEQLVPANALVDVYKKESELLRSQLSLELGRSGRSLDAFSPTPPMSADRRTGTPASAIDIADDEPVPGDDLHEEEEDGSVRERAPAVPSIDIDEVGDSPDMDGELGADLPLTPLSEVTANSIISGGSPSGNGGTHDPMDDDEDAEL